MAANEEHGPAKLKEVVEYKVTSYSGSSLDMITVLGEKVPNVTDLRKEQSEPVQRAHQGIQSEWSWVCLVLTPNRISPLLLVIVWVGKGIIDGGDDNQEPSEDCQDLVCPDSLNIVGFAFGEGVCLGEASHVADCWWLTS